MAQRDAHGAEQVFGGYAVGIPFRDGVFRITQFVGFAVGERALFVVPFHVEFAFRLHTVDGLVVEHTSVALEERPVFAADIDQHGRETVGPASSFAMNAARVPQFRLGAPRVAVAATAGIACIHGAKPFARGAGIVIKPVAVAETHGHGRFAVYPVGLRVVGHGAVKEDGGDAGREGIAFGHVDVQDIQPLVLASREAGGQG